MSNQFKNSLIILSILGLMTLQGCTSNSTKSDSGIEIVSLKSEESNVNRIIQIGKNQPEWTIKAPPEDFDFKYFVGVSSPAKSEQEAKNGAIANAFQQFLLETGAEIEIFNKYQEKYSGTTTSTIKENISGENNFSVASSQFIQNSQNTDYFYKRNIHKIGEASNLVGMVLVAIDKKEIKRIQDFNKMMRKPVVIIALGMSYVKLNEYPSKELAKNIARKIAKAEAYAELSEKANNVNVTNNFSFNKIDKTDSSVISYNTRGLIKNSKIIKENSFIEDGLLHYRIKVQSSFQRENQYDVR